MQDLGKFLFLIGLIVTVAGAWLWSGRGLGWLGKLPGDIFYQKGAASFYFPIATCLVVSALLSLLGWFLRR